MDSGLLASARPRNDTLVRDRPFHAAFQILVLLALGAADQADLFQEVGGLELVALLDLPHAVILPGTHVLRIGRERALIPDLGKLIVAELAGGVAQIIRNVGMVVLVHSLEGRECLGVFAVAHQRMGGAVLVAELLLGLLLFLLVFRPGFGVGRAARA